MDDIELFEDCGGIRCENHLLEMVYDNLVAAIGTERGLDGRGDGTAGIDVANDGAIFRVVAVARDEELVVCTCWGDLKNEIHLHGTQC